MVIAVRPVRVVQNIVHNVVDVVAVRDRLVAALRPVQMLELIRLVAKALFPGVNLGLPVFLLRVFPLQRAAVQLAGLAGLRKNVAGLVIVEDFLGDAFLQNVQVVLDALVIVVADLVERLAVVYFVQVDFVDF